MNKIVFFITSNQTKVQQARTALGKFGIKIIAKKLDVIEPREEEPEKVVLEKAMRAFEQIKVPLIVEDSGIFINALNGFPKTFVHFVQDTIGITNILKMMEGVKDRSAEFRQSLAYIEPGMTKPKIFSYVDGNYTVADKIWIPAFNDAKDFDTILIPPGQNKPVCMFSRKWRIERDIKQNYEKIHYHQLAHWLRSRNLKL